MRFHVVTLPLLAAVLASTVFACGGGASTSPSPTAPAPKAEASDAGGLVGPNATSGVDAAGLEKLTAEEAKSGTCDGEHKAALEKFLDDVEANVRAKSDDGKPIKIESFTKRVLPLSEAAKGIQLTLSGKGTQVHVIAFSSKDVSLDALVGTQAATTMRSPYQRDVSTGPAQIALPKVGGAVPLETDSRQIEMKPGASLDVRMRGKGCAGVVVFSKS